MNLIEKVYNEMSTDADGNGVPVACVPKTTIRIFPVNREDENEGLRPHLWWTKTPDFVHVYRGISPTNRGFFPTSTVCLLHLTQARRVFLISQ
jgi:hypothetical protein